MNNNFSDEDANGLKEILKPSQIAREIFNLEKQNKALQTLNKIYRFKFFEFKPTLAHKTPLD